MSQLLPARPAKKSQQDVMKALPAIISTPALATNIDLLYDEIESCHRTKKFKRKQK